MFSLGIIILREKGTRGTGLGLGDREGFKQRKIIIYLFIYFGIQNQVFKIIIHLKLFFICFVILIF